MAGMVTAVVYVSTGSANPLYVARQNLLSGKRNSSAQRSPSRRDEFPKKRCEASFIEKPLRHGDHRVVQPLIRVADRDAVQI